MLWQAQSLFMLNLQEICNVLNGQTEGLLISLASASLPITHYPEYDTGRVTIMLGMYRWTHYVADILVYV